jgi:hypothetical protein
VETPPATAALTFSGGNRLLAFGVTAGSDVNQGGFHVTLVSRLSVVTAYIAIAFVGAIVLGVF